MDVSTLLKQLPVATQPAYRQVLQLLLQQIIPLARPLVLGISGAQGSGKSTLAKLLCGLLQQQGISAATVSLDDYYLSQHARRQLAAQVHPLLAQRGVPGTHDIHKALADVQAVLAGRAVALPQFDKAMDDRLADLPKQQFDVLIVEGWCLGVEAEAAEVLAQPVNDFEAAADAKGVWRSYVNQQLAGSYAELWAFLQPLIWLKAPDWSSVCRWRAQQEQQLWQQRGKGMSATELAAFMLPFQRLTQASWQQLPTRANYTIVLNEAQQPLLSPGGCW
ncbi:MAG: kinase [Alishewanella sp.]|nr:kinase [Alishewanella sp.]MDP5186850.1 kinase [Alishewanella sp.]